MTLTTCVYTHTHIYILYTSGIAIDARAKDILLLDI